MMKLRFHPRQAPWGLRHDILLLSLPVALSVFSHDTVSPMRTGTVTTASSDHSGTGLASSSWSTIQCLLNACMHACMSPQRMTVQNPKILLFLSVMRQPSPFTFLLQPPRGSLWPPHKNLLLWPGESVSLTNQSKNPSPFGWSDFPVVSGFGHEDES